MTIEGRPEHLNAEMKARIGEALAAKLVANGDLAIGERDRAAGDIARHLGRLMDGYELTKRLDDREGWNCSFEIVEELNAVGSLIEDEIEGAAKAWIEDNKIVPPLPVGARVSTRWGHETITGTIHEVYPYRAGKYSIKRDDGRTGFALVNFEDVTPLGDDDPQARLEAAIDG